MTRQEPGEPPTSSALELDTSRAGVAVMRLNRPERANAVTLILARDLRSTIRALAADRQCRAIVITGAGRVFCAGADRDLVAGGDNRSATGKGGGGIGPEVLEVFLDVVRSVRSAPVPVIAAVNGAAVGAGMALAMAADIRVVAEAASFEVGTIRVGLTGGEAGLSWLLPRIVGVSRAMELLLTGRRVGAAEAADIGLVSRIAPDAEQCLDAALEVAEAIRSNSPSAVRLTKQLVLANLDASFDTALGNEALAQLYVSHGSDFREAAAAMAARRPPSFAADESAT